MRIKEELCCKIIFVVRSKQKVTLITEEFWKPHDERVIINNGTLWPVTRRSVRYKRQVKFEECLQHSDHNFYILV